MQFDYQNRIKTTLQESTLGQLLSQMTMQSVFYTDSTLSAPWHIALPAMEGCMMFHLVLEGSATVKVDKDKFPLTKGDFVLLPKGQGHHISDGSDIPATPLHDLPIKIVSDRYEVLHYGGTGNTARLVCGSVTFTHPLTLKLLGLLPSHIVIPRDNVMCSQVINAISALLLTEAANISPGADGVLKKLADVLIITAIREYLEQQKDQLPGWIGALEDSRIAKAIERVHQSPDIHWTLDKLAREVGMSRTSFAVQFKQLIGHSPIDYLTEWRMNQAYAALQQRQDSILAIALDYGYQSESSFSRAFKKTFGTSPGEVRKHT
ncbi:AraC family transcriptional regulator [Aestuariibacter halophilus]|uniref:AraC family transcriptional regulator n=1 Tax=Fluctibacter halophilus TaxID=226011 RepID=A0ABS8GCL4_9ALTE|nr:AraC family transcriptional regulator [Aestuariibacter halophilus]MCC2618123.1 AraC family transcriptional regulator [Aestuariibacter halophilus]